MSEATPEKRAYARGYATGRSDKLKEEARHQAEMKAVAIRAERAEAAAGIGHCTDCAHWEPPEHCTWGYCNAGRQPGSPHGTWAQTSGSPGERPATTPHFGCVLFLPKDAIAAAIRRAAEGAIKP